MQQAIARDWWESIFPDEPVPTVAVVGYTTPETQDAVIVDCMQARRPPGATYFILRTDRGWQVSGEFPIDLLNQAVWTCSAQHPLDPAGEHGLLSYAQLEYAYAYLAERSVPCLEQHGYAVTPVPSWEQFAQPELGIADWSPYWQLPADERTTAFTDCPPPPVGSNWGPRVDD